MHVLRLKQTLTVFLFLLSFPRQAYENCSVLEARICYNVAKLMSLMSERYQRFNFLRVLVCVCVSARAWLCVCPLWCPCDYLARGSGPQSDTAALLHAGRRRSAVRNSSWTFRPRRVLPPWSIPNLVAISAVASFKAVSRSDSHQCFM